MKCWELQHPFQVRITASGSYLWGDAKNSSWYAFDWMHVRGRLEKSYLILCLTLLVFLSWVESKGEERTMRWSVVSSALCLYRHQCGVDVLSLPLFLTVPFPEIPSPNALLLQWANALLLQWARRTGIIHWNVQLNREWALQKGSDTDQSYDHWTNFQRLQPSDGQVVFCFFSCLFFFIKIS